MTSIRHSDTPALQRRRELVANELRLIDAELTRRAERAMQDQSHDRAEWAKANPDPASEQPWLLRAAGLI